MDHISLLLGEFVSDRVRSSTGSQVSLRIMYEEFCSYLSQRSVMSLLPMCKFKDMLLYRHGLSVVGQNVKNVMLDSVRGPIFIGMKKKEEQDDNVIELIQFFIGHYCTIRPDLKSCTKDFVHVINEFLSSLSNKDSVNSFTLRLDSIQSTLVTEIVYPNDTLSTNGKMVTVDTKKLMKILQSLYPVGTNGPYIEGLGTIFLESKDSSKEDGLISFFRTTYSEVKKLCPNITFHMLPFDLLASIHLKFPSLCENYSFLTTLVIVTSRNNVYNNPVMMKRLLSSIPLDFSEPLSKWNKVTGGNQWNNETMEQVYHKYFKFFLGLEDTLLPDELLRKMNEYSSITFPFTPNFSHILVSKELLTPKDIVSKVKEGKLVLMDDIIRIIGTIGTMRLWIEVMVEILQLSVSTLQIDITDQLASYIESMISRINMYEKPMEEWLLCLNNSNPTIVNREIKRLYQTYRTMERVSLWILHTHDSLYPGESISNRILSPKGYLENLGKMDYDERRSRELIELLYFVEINRISMDVTLNMMSEGTYLSSLSSRFSMTGNKKRPVFVVRIPSHLPLRDSELSSLWTLEPEVYSVPLSSLDPEDPIHDNNPNVEEFSVDPYSLVSTITSQLGRHY